jgi:hypothetical protein
METERAGPLSPKESRDLAIVAGVLFILLAIAAVALMYRALPSQDGDIVGWKILLLAGLAGLVGGCARSLFMFIREIGGHGGHGPEFYRSRWFLYLVKPALGLVSGPLLLFAIVEGLIPAFGAQDRQYGLIPSVLVSIVGGIFFEEVFTLVSALIPEPHKKSVTAKSRNTAYDDHA